MDKKKPLSQLKTVGHGITIFPADACGKYDGFAENAKQRGRNQAMKFLSRFFAVLPFRNAKLPAALLLCLTAWMLSAATQADFKEFLPPARLVHNGSFREGIAALEQIAPRNPFATAALYLIYSRGYCGESVNYRKAAQYLDSLFGTHFHNREWLVFWSQKRFPQVDDLSGVILHDELGPSRYELRGDHPLKACYTEQMFAIGGVIPRVIFEMSWPEKPAPWNLQAVETARVMGNPAALLWLPDPNISRESTEFAAYLKRLEQAAELGHVPSMIELAGYCQKNGFGFPVNHRRAGEILRTAKKKLLRYSNVGCKHAESDLKTVRRMLHSVPDFTRSTVGLLEDMQRNQSSPRPDLLLDAALADEIGRRNDHVECAFFRLRPRLFTGNISDELRRKVETIAEAGSSHAICYLYARQSDQFRQYYYCYLAGKYAVPLPGLATPEACYRKAFLLLQARKYAPAGNEYVDGLKLLAPVLAAAREEYEREFGRAEKEEADTTIRIARREFARPEWETLQGRRRLKITVRASDQPNYLDCTLKPVPDEGYYELSVHSLTSLPSNEVWVDLLLADGSRKRCFVNNPYHGKRPVRFRINIAPTQKNFELTVTGF